jgi:prolyl 4-hydroxylase
MNEQILFKEPYISYFHNLFTNKECDYIIKMSERIGKFKRSTIHNTQTKLSEIHDMRTSSTFDDDEGNFDFVRFKSYETLKDKFWYIKNFNINHFEKTQMQRYNESEYVLHHLDCFNTVNKKTTENDKIATLLIYLNDDFEGGETSFNKLNLKIKPEKGSALYFEFKYVDALNEMTRHEALPVIKGTKYVITSWIRNKPYG